MNDTDLSSLAMNYGSQVMGASMDMAMQYSSQKWKEKEAKKVRDWNEEMYQKQLEDNRQNWRMANEYNLPSAQLARLRDAGLNPLLMYGDGASGMVAAQPSAGAHPGNAPAATGSMNTNFGQALAGAAMLNAQINNLKADTALKMSEAGESGARTENLNFDLAYKMDSKDLNLQVLASQYDLNKSMESLNREQRIYIARETDKIDAEINKVLQDIENSKNLTAAQINDINQRLEGYWKELPHIINNLDAQSALAVANAYAARVSANIQKQLMSPEYIKILQGQAGQDLLNAIKSGRGQDIDNALKAIQYESLPKPGENYFEYGRFMKYGVGPMLEVVKDAAIGAGSIMVAKRGLGGKVTKVRGFTP